jgi:hypothetical protein
MHGVHARQRLHLLRDDEQHADLLRLLLDAVTKRDNGYQPEAQAREGEQPRLRARDRLPRLRFGLVSNWPALSIGLQPAVTKRDNGYQPEAQAREGEQPRLQARDRLPRLRFGLVTNWPALGIGLQPAA